MMIFPGGICRRLLFSGKTHLVYVRVVVSINKMLTEGPLFGKRARKAPTVLEELSFTPLAHWTPRVYKSPCRIELESGGNARPFARFSVVKGMKPNPHSRWLPQQESPYLPLFRLSMEHIR